MELFCKKEKKTPDGKKHLTEYKLINDMLEIGTMGTVKSYGISVKKFSYDNFEYVRYPDISTKPDKVIKIIKNMFDNDISPQAAKEVIENMVKNT